MNIISRDRTRHATVSDGTALYCEIVRWIRCATTVEFLQVRSAPRRWATVSTVLSRSIDRCHCTTVASLDGTSPKPWDLDSDLGVQIWI